MWNSAGWVLLGERTVNHGVDNDVIDVAQVVGQNRYTKLTVVVLDSDLEMLEMKLFFRSGQSYPTDMKFFFREGTRTREIKLPSEILTRVTFKYRNTPGGGRARVQLWGGTDGNAAAQPPPPPPPVQKPVWDSSGWTMLGERTVDGRTDEDMMDVSAPAMYGRMMVVVLDSDLEMIEHRLHFKNGKSYKTDLKQFFREGTRTRELKLPSDVLTRVSFKYKNVPGGGKARVQVWARK